MDQIHRLPKPVPYRWIPKAGKLPLLFIPSISSCIGSDAPKPETVLKTSCWRMRFLFLPSTRPRNKVQQRQMLLSFSSSFPFTHFYLFFLFSPFFFFLQLDIFFFCILPLQPFSVSPFFPPSFDLFCVISRPPFSLSSFLLNLQTTGVRCGIHRRFLHGILFQAVDVGGRCPCFPRGSLHQFPCSCLLYLHARCKPFRLATNPETLEGGAGMSLLSHSITLWIFQTSAWFFCPSHQMQSKHARDVQAELGHEDQVAKQRAFRGIKESSFLFFGALLSKMVIAPAKKFGARGARGSTCPLSAH